MSEHTAELDMDAHYTMEGMPGVAWYLVGYVRELALDDETGEPVIEWLGDLPDAWVEDRSMVRAVMVGDDREHEIDVSELRPLAELDYCAECGQVGCAHDGRDRD